VPPPGIKNRYYTKCCRSTYSYLAIWSQARSATVPRLKHAVFTKLHYLFNLFNQRFQSVLCLLNVSVTRHLSINTCFIYIYCCVESERVAILSSLCVCHFMWSTGTRHVTWGIRGDYERNIAVCIFCRAGIPQKDLLQSPPSYTRGLSYHRIWASFVRRCLTNWTTAWQLFLLHVARKY